MRNDWKPNTIQYLVPFQISQSHSENLAWGGIIHCMCSVWKWLSKKKNCSPALCPQPRNSQSHFNTSTWPPKHTQFWKVTAVMIVFSQVAKLGSWYDVQWAGINNWFPDCKSETFWDIVMKLHTLTPHESRMCPINFEVQRSRSWDIVN